MHEDAWNAAIETARTIRVLLTHPNKNQTLRNMLKEQLKQAILTIESKSSADIETLFFIMSETRPLGHWNIGQVIKMD